MARSTPDKEIERTMEKIAKKQTVPISGKLSAGEVVTFDQTVKCFKKKNGQLVQVRCPDVITIETT